jgi:hypothetical protein
MPITLEENTPIPGVKVPNLGDTVTFAIAHASVVPWTDVSTGEVKIGKDGKPRTQDKLIAVVISGTASTGKKGEYKPIEVGQEVAVYLAGHHRWEYIQAKKAHGALNVGDVGTWTYERDEKSSLAGGNDKHVTSFELRPANGNEQRFVDQAEALYRRMTATQLEPATVGGGPADDDAEDPF